MASPAAFPATRGVDCILGLYVSHKLVLHVTGATRLLSRYPPRRVADALVVAVPDVPLRQQVVAPSRSVDTVLVEAGLRLGLRKDHYLHREQWHSYALSRRRTGHLNLRLQRRTQASPHSKGRPPNRLAANNSKPGGPPSSAPPQGSGRSTCLSLSLSLSHSLSLSLSPTVPLVLAEYLHFTAGSPQVQQSQRFVCGRQLSFFRQGCDAGEFPPLHRALCAPPTVAEGKRCYAPRGFWAPVSKKGWPPSATALSNWNEKQSDCQCNLCSQ